jgi:hypothetical protein
LLALTQVHKANTVRRGCIERIHASITLFWRQTEKKKDLGDGERMLASLIGMNMTSFGSILSDDANYGKALMRVGNYHEKMAVEQVTLTLI